MKRISPKKKEEVVLRFLNGESIDNPFVENESSMKELSTRSLLLIVFFFIFTLLSLLVPVVVIPIFLLFLVLRKKHKNYRIVFLSIVIFSASFIASSRGLFLFTGDDYIRYYDTFKDISWDNILKIRYGLGLEYGIPILFLVIKTLLGTLDARILLFLINILYYSLLTHFILKYEGENAEWVLLFIFLLPFSYYFSTQLIRQAFATVFLYGAWREQNKKVCFFYFILAIVFHLTSIVIFLIIRYSKKIHLFTLLAMIIISAIALLYSADVLDFLIKIMDYSRFSNNLLFLYIAQRGPGYIKTISESSYFAGDIQTIRNLIFILVFYLINIHSKKTNRKVTSEMKIVMVFISISLVVLPFQMLAQRIGLFTLIFSGVFLFDSIKRYSLQLRMVLVGLLCSYLWYVNFTQIFQVKSTTVMALYDVSTPLQLFFGK